MVSDNRSTTPRYRQSRRNAPRLPMGPGELSVRATLDELKSDLAQVDRMIRLLEWASVRPKAARA